MSADRVSVRLIRDTQKSSRPLTEIARVGFLDQTVISPRALYSTRITPAAETRNGGASMLPRQEKEKHGRPELSLSGMPQGFDGGMTIGCCCAMHQSWESSYYHSFHLWQSVSLGAGGVPSRYQWRLLCQLSAWRSSIAPDLRRWSEKVN